MHSERVFFLCLVSGKIIIYVCCQFRLTLKACIKDVHVSSRGSQPGYMY